MRKPPQHSAEDALHCAVWPRINNEAIEQWGRGLVRGGQMREDDAMYVTYRTFSTRTDALKHAHTQTHFSIDQIAPPQR